MKRFTYILLASLLGCLAAGCDALGSLAGSKMKSAQGRPYEVIVVCEQPQWSGPVGDTLRAVLTAPVPYLNQTEPLFDVLRVRKQDINDMIADHRNLLRIVVDPALAETSTAVQYDVTASPQIVLTLQGPDDPSLVGYLSAHRSELVQVLEKAERDRAMENARRFSNPGIGEALYRNFGMRMAVPKGYTLAVDTPDFVWARYEYPEASQGFFVYSYPYTGPEALSAEALLAARNRFAARIPGPSDGSYMTTSEVFPPAFSMFRLEGRLWCELRGFWDVEGDFMGGPFVSYTTVDTASNRVVTIDGFVYSPKHHKRNLLRGVEHLLYTVEFPQE